MTKLTPLLAALIALTSFAACSTEVEDADQAPRIDTPIVRIADYDRAVDILDANELPNDLELVELADIDADGEVGGICACTTYECVKDYVLDTYGCGVCVLAVCDGEFAGGCFVCDSGANQLVTARVRDATAAR